MSRIGPSAVLTAIVVLLGCAQQAAAASSWSASFFRAPSLRFPDSGARIAADVARDGSGLAAWWATNTNATRDRSRGLKVTLTSAPGELAPVIEIARQGTGEVAVAAQRDGRALVAYISGSRLHVVTRARNGGPLIGRAVAVDTGSTINALAVRPDADGGWTIVERVFVFSGLPYRVRALRLTADGSIRSDRDLGVGAFGLERAGSLPLAVTGKGRAWIAVDAQSSGPQPASGAVYSGAGGAPFGQGRSPGDPDAANLGVVAGPDSVAVSWLRPANRGDAGVFGASRFAIGDATGALGASFAPAVSSPRRAFAPVAAPLHAGAWLFAWQEKTAPAGFSRAAPVRGTSLRAGRLARPRSIIDAKVLDLALTPLAGGQALLSGASALPSSLGKLLLRRFGPDGRAMGSVRAPFGAVSRRYEYPQTLVRGSGGWVIATRFETRPVRGARVAIRRL